MARRGGKKGDYLMTDDYSGFTEYASKMKQDYWGNYTAKPLIRNLQEIATGMDDPLPVLVYRGPQYEITSPCDAEIIPLFIGTTNIRTPSTGNIQILGLDPAIPDMSVGCNFEVR